MTKTNLKDTKWEDRFEHQKAILFNEEDFNSKGTKLQVIKIKPGGKIKPHFHKVRSEAFYVLDGVGSIKLGDEDLSCSANDYMLCKPNTIHSFTNTGDIDFIIAVFRTNDPGDTDMLWVDGSE
jgi:mannose-6-phosphate isomerase-like protein (cupin superfamily)